MIRFFPSPYPDESCYSLFVRYSKHVGNDNLFTSVKELLGKMHLRITPLFIGNLDYMCSLFPEGSEYTPEYFINNHTILPFYKPFIPTERYNKAISDLKYGLLNSVYSGLGITAGSMLKTNGIKYCPLCLEDDKEIYNEAYIHRAHQIQGACACSKHNSLLKVVEINTDSLNELFDINEYNNSDEDAEVTPKLTNEILKLSSDLDYLMRNNDSFGDIETIRKKYNTCMHEKEYISPSGLINQVKLHEEFFEFYPKEFLYCLQSDVKIDDENSWLRVITRKKMKMVHPIRHLIFIRFLFGSAESFVQYSKTEYLPFGEPPYPCLNQESNHYNELLIEKCTIKTNNHTSKAIGVFECPNCQFVYTLNEDKYKENGFNKVKLYNQKSIGLMKGESGFEEQYKREIENLLLEHPDLSRREIIKENSKAYRWLYKYHKDWLESIIPSPKEHKDFYKNSRIDWEERDKEFLEKVKSAIQSIYNKPFPIRITATQIAKECNHLALSRDIKKMPLTKSYILQSEESLENFHKRKIDFVISRLVAEERRLVRHDILRKSGIPSEYYYNYDEYIDEIIKRL